MRPRTKTIKTLRTWHISSNKCDHSDGVHQKLADSGAALTCMSLAFRLQDALEHHVLVQRTTNWLQSAQLVFSQIMWFDHCSSTQTKKQQEKQQLRLYGIRGSILFTSLPLKLVYTYSQVIKSQIALNKLEPIHCQ